MGLLSREAILGASDLPSEDVAVPEWGGVVRVRMLTGAERDRFEASMLVRGGKKLDFNMQNVRARLVALTVVGEDGKRLFTDGDVEALGQKSAAALNRVFTVAQRLNGLKEDAVEAAAEDFFGGRSDDSISD